VDGLTLGVVATSGKEHERRLPIHPRHLERIDADLRRRIVLERGYGRLYGLSDEELATQVGGLLPRAQLLAECDVAVIANWLSCGPIKCCGAGPTASRMLS
jgi:alanine dehydrogenase